MTYQEEKSKRAEIISALVKHFPGASVVPGGDGEPRYIQLPGEGGLWLRYDSRKDRVEVSGQWPRSKTSGDNNTFVPRDVSYNGACATITISTSKPIEIIARDITRRFLPEYNKYLPEAIASRDKHDAHLRTVAGNVEELVAIFPASRVRRNSDQYNTTFDVGQSNATLGGEVKVNSETCEVKMNLSIANTRKLARFLKTL